MDDREALRAIRRVVEDTVTHLREIDAALARTPPAEDEIEEAATVGVLDKRLARDDNRALVAAVETLCDELVALRARAVLRGPSR